MRIYDEDRATSLQNELYKATVNCHIGKHSIILNRRAVRLVLISFYGRWRCGCSASLEITTNQKPENSKIKPIM